MKQRYYRIFLIYLPIICLTLFIIIYRKNKENNQLKDKELQRSSQTDQRHLDYSSIRSLEQSNMKGAAKFDKAPFDKLVQRLRPLLKENLAQKHERRVLLTEADPASSKEQPSPELTSLDEIFSRLKSHEMSDDDVVSLGRYVYEVENQMAPELYAAIFSYLYETSDSYFENILLRVLSYDMPSYQVFTRLTRLSDDVVRQIPKELCDELATKGIAIYTRSKNEDLKQLVTRLLSSIAEKSTKVHQFFSDLLKSTRGGDYSEIATTVVGHNNTKLDIEVATTMVQKYYTGEISDVQAYGLLFIFAHSDAIQNNDVFSVLDPLLIQLFNDLENKGYDMKRNFMMVAAKSHQRKYLPMVWSEVNELVQKPQLDDRDLNYFKILVGGLVTWNEKDVLQPALDLFQNKDLQRELAAILLGERLSRIKYKSEKTQDQSKVLECERYVQERLLHDVISYVEDDEQTIENLASYISSVGFEEYIQRLKEKLPYLSELKRKIISGRLK